MAVVCVATLASGALAQDRERDGAREHGEKGRHSENEGEKENEREHVHESRWERRRKKGRVGGVTGVQGSKAHAPAIF